MNNKPKAEAANKPQPMMIRSPDGRLFPVQSIRACATRLGQILRFITGEDKKFMSWQGLQNLIEAGVTEFPNGALSGWSFYECVDDDAQVAEFLNHIGVKGASKSSAHLSQSHNSSITQENNSTITQYNNGTVKPLWNHSDVTVTSDSDHNSTCHSDSKVTSNRVEIDLADEFDRVFNSYDWRWKRGTELRWAHTHPHGAVIFSRGFYTRLQQ